MNIQNHKSDLQKLNDLDRQREQRIKYWNERIIPAVSSHFEKVAELDLNLNFQINDSMFNNESLILSFGKKPSCYRYNPDCPVNKKAGKSGHIFMEDAYLGISLMYSGKICGWMVKPRIKDLIKNDEDVVNLGVIAQSECNIEWLDNIIRQFFKITFEWKSQEGVIFQEVNRNMIGF